ncbi:MAG: PAS domain S-box protein [Anaerolineae bacterium]|nr:PAS domain S-box protein [Anaerolineae bacterium]
MNNKKSTIDIPQLAQFAIDRSTDPIFWIAPDAHLVYVNEATCRTLGYSRDELLSMTVFDFDPAFPQEAWPDHWQELKQRGSLTIETKHRTKEGRIFPIEVTVNYLAFDGQEYNCAFARDISTQKEKEARLRWFGLAVEQNPDGIAIADADGNIQFANTAWAELHGYNLEEIEGRHLSIFHTEEQMQKDVIPFNEKVFQDGFHRGEMGHARKDGTAFPTMMTTALIRDDQDNPIGLVGIARDITAQKQAEAERERLQEEIIEAQRRAIAELSTPVIPIMDRVIVMPLVGSIDSLRARDITRSLMAGIGQHRAKVVILDVTGVAIMDTGVVNHLNKTIQAARLKGARTIVTGISDAVAEAIVDLGIDWGHIETLSDLQTGLIVALGTLGVQLNKA